MFRSAYGELQQKVKEWETINLERFQSNQEVEKIFNLSLDMIGAGSLDGYFTKINSSFESILGYTESEFLKRPFISFVHGDDVKKTQKALTQAVNGKQNISIENRYICKDGSFKWIDWRVLSIVQDNVFIAVGRDVTKRKSVEKERIERKLQNISAELLATEERERRILAEDIHDHVSQSLALSLSKLKSFTRFKKKLDFKELNSIETCLDQAVRDLRTLTFQVYPPMLKDLGLVAAIEWLVENENKQKRVHITFSNNINQSIFLDETYNALFYRSIRELISNIEKHAEAKNAQIKLSIFEGQLAANIEDDGVGFNLEELRNKNKIGFGLFSINERIKGLGGKVEIDTSPNNGTNVLITAPLFLK